MKGYHANSKCKSCGSSYQGRGPQKYCSMRCYLMSKVQIQNQCWIWTGAKLYNGYGTLCFAKKPQRAHRAAYEVFKGPIKDGLWVLHRCDMPACVNPDHLFLGTTAENSADRNRKNRTAKGARSNRSSLTDEKVREILRDPRPNTEIAKELGLSTPAIWAIKHRKTWKHVA